MSAAYYGAHPFSRPVRGTPTGLRAQTGPRLRALWARDYPLADAVLALVGDIDLPALLAQIELSAQVARDMSERPSQTSPRPPAGLGPRASASSSRTASRPTSPSASPACASPTRTRRRSTC